MRIYVGDGNAHAVWEVAPWLRVTGDRDVMLSPVLLEALRDALASSTFGM
jgi:hypothetical protein